MTISVNNTYCVVVSSLKAKKYSHTYIRIIYESDFQLVSALHLEFTSAVVP